LVPRNHTCTFLPHPRPSDVNGLTRSTSMFRYGEAKWTSTLLTYQNIILEVLSRGRVIWPCLSNMILPLTEPELSQGKTSKFVKIYRTSIIIVLPHYLVFKYFGNNTKNIHYWLKYQKGLFYRVYIPNNYTVFRPIL